MVTPTAASRVSESCPSCASSLRPDAIFCHACGLEVCPVCPHCAQSRRPLTTLQAGRKFSPWCSGCYSLLDACSACGRWLSPGTTACPDPNCLAPVLPNHPTHTGRRGDGCGIPSRRSAPYSLLDSALSSQAWEAPTGSAVHAAAVAHGSLYVWAGPSIRRIHLDNTPAEEGEILWPLGAGIGGQPLPDVPFHERIAVVGEGLMLARKSGFAWLRARPNEVARNLVSGAVPLTQASSPYGWAGWVRQAAAGPDAPPELWLARLFPDTTEPQPYLAVLPDPGAALIPRSNVVVRDTTAWWLGVEGDVWSADMDTGEVRRASKQGLLTSYDRIGAALVWVDSQQRPGFVAEVGEGSALVAWVAPTQSHEISRAPSAAGVGPLRSVHLAGNWLTVVGDQITLLNATDGSRREGLSDSTQRLPPGRWIAGCLTVTERRETSGRQRQYPQLVALTDDTNAPGGGQAALSLSAIDIHTGTIDSIAAARLASLTTPPLGLLAAEDALYTAHTDGIIGLFWKE